MAAAYATALILLIGALALGRAIAWALGSRETSWVEPALGFAVLALAASASTRLFDSATASALALGAITAASLAYLRGRLLSFDDLRLAAPPAAIAAAIASIPFLASGRIGVLGAGINNDLAGHLLWSEWLRDQSEPTPVGLLNGYPIGPHSLVASLEQAFALTALSGFVGLLIAVAALTALTALGLMRELPPVRRSIASGLVALPFLAASAFAIGGFKETAMGLILLGFVVALAKLEREFPGDAAGWIPLALLGAGAIAVYSYPGLYWLIAAAGLLAAAGALRALRKRELGATVRGAAPLAAAAIVVFALVGASELDRAADFRERSGAQSTIEGNSKLSRAVSPLEALGVWPDSNALAGTNGPPDWALFGAIGLIALAYAALWWLRRGTLTVPLGVIGAVVVYAGTLAEAGFYVQAKALAVPAALVMAMLLRPLLDPGPAGSGKRPRVGRVARVALAAVFVAIAAVSSFLVLRGAIVAPNEHANELAAVRERTGGEWTLYLTGDRYSDYELRSTRVASPFLNAQIIVPSTPGKDYVLPLDFDSIAPEALDQFRWVLTTGAAYRSAPPPNLRLVERTGSYELWKRTGPTPLTTRVFGEKGRPGRIVGCGSTGVPSGALAAASSVSVISPRPVIGRPETWAPTNELGPGDSATRTLPLPPGRWLLSLQYLTPLGGVTVEAGKRRFELPPSMEGAVPGRLGPFWAVGEVDSDGKPLKVRVRVEEQSAIQRLLGVDRKATIGNIAASAPSSAATITPSEACGRFVDHYSVPDSALDPGEIARRRRVAHRALSGHYQPPSSRPPTRPRSAIRPRLARATAALTPLLLGAMTEETKR